MKIAICRHGETVENKTGVIQGWLPGALTELGKEQAKVLAQEISIYKPDIIFASDLGRCLDTLSIISLHAELPPSRDLIVDWRLRERSFGALEGKASAGIDWIDFFNHSYDDTKFGEETNRELYDRIKKSLIDIIALSARSNRNRILIITHGGVVNAVKSIEYGLGYEPQKFPNAKLIDIDYGALVKNLESETELHETVHN